MKRLIIDCDPGNGVPGANVDDSLALALAISSPDISLELITTVSGNTPANIGYSVAQDMVDRLRLNIPVRKGEDQALEEPSEPWRQQLDQRVHQLNLTHLWNGIPNPPTLKPPQQDAIDAIGQLICNNPGEMTLVAIGPLTNVARAIQRYPQLAKSVVEIVIMGGVFNVDNYLKDTNFGIDPEAAHQVLNSGASITVVPLDVTTQTLMTHQDLNRIEYIDTPLAHYIVDTIRPWMDFSINTRHLNGSWIHDVLTVAWLLDKRVATAIDYRVGIELRAGTTRGRCWRYHPPLRNSVGIDESAGASVYVLTTVDSQLLLNILEKNLAMAKHPT